MLILLVQDKKDVAGIGTLATQILQIYTDVSKSLYRHEKSEFSLFLQDSSKKNTLYLQKSYFCTNISGIASLKHHQPN
ncbi:MAG: hypothetical protein RLZZ628_1603 [Bacteroidota bacterium]|jgi:hypothetical protein